MSGFWHFVHYLAFTVWLGGALSALVAGLTMERIDRSLWGAVVDAQSAIYRALVGPGALVTVLSGIVLTLRMYGSMSGGQAGSWLGTMQGLGTIGPLVTLLGAMPAASKLARLEPLGPQAAAFDKLRQRLAITGTIGGLLGLIALLAGSFYQRV
jgi:hypothetical protein